ncbi:hypothetical protein BP6252_12940 [Coleophoma cylindrospora]|uniref:Endosomal spry domain-containing protein n=1 Tax=Coleophoma cylindrospora TaxID=1849047 RepID=A0A3D8QDC1_9HELO|nr:hypothetical protein BP6252_12940 [Coleophoma cylindrospora]
MAPVPESSITSIIKRSAHSLFTRSGAILPRSTVNPSAGVTDPTSIPNKAVFILFGVLGVGFVCTGIWFFFWAKNGGFYFHDNDWDDYKSTVLRRKGPNGTTLSGATESTDLGGGSVVHGQKKWRRKNKKSEKSRYKDDFGEDEGSSMTGSSAMSEVKWAQNEKNDRRSKRGLRGGHMDDEESVIDAVRAYRHEKPARVGGINKQPDGSSWDGSNTDAQTDLLSNREKTPTSTPTKTKKRERKDSFTTAKGGIRKVMPSTTANTSTSFWSRSNASQEPTPSEDDRIKSEARKLQEKGRAAQRRDFSFQKGDDSSTVADEAEERRTRREERRARRRAEREALVPGNYAESSVGGSEISETGTKTYHHVIPGLSSTAGSDYASDRRKQRKGGYRRGGTGSDEE